MAVYLYNIRHLTIIHVFSDFVLKIRLIRLGFSLQKQKFMYSNSQPTDSLSRVITISPKRQLWDIVILSHASLIPVEFT